MKCPLPLTKKIPTFFVKTTVIQSLQTIDAALRRRITDADHTVICKDLRHAPAWIADLLP